MVKAQVTPSTRDSTAGTIFGAGGLKALADATNPQLMTDVLDCNTFPQCRAFNVMALDFPSNDLINAILALNPGFVPGALYSESPAQQLVLLCDCQFACISL